MWKISDELREIMVDLIFKDGCYNGPQFKDTPRWTKAEMLQQDDDTILCLFKSFTTGKRTIEAMAKEQIAVHDWLNHG
jgi:hypothetical protein